MLYIGCKTKEQVNEIWKVFYKEKQNPLLTDFINFEEECVYISIDGEHICLKDEMMEQAQPEDNFLQYKDVISIINKVRPKIEWIKKEKSETGIIKSSYIGYLNEIPIFTLMNFINDEDLFYLRLMGNFWGKTVSVNFSFEGTKEECEIKSIELL